MDKPIKIKVLKGDSELLNKTLVLIPKERMLWYCIKHKIEVVDTWEELSIIEEENKKSIDSIFFDMHLFSTSYPEGLKFIDEVKFIK